MSLISERKAIDDAVDEFASAMKKRMHSKRKQGWCGWDDRGMKGELQERLLFNAASGAIKSDEKSLIDVANLSMIIRRLK